MKRKLIALALFALIYAFPFRYAFMDLQQPHAFGMFSALVSLLGFVGCLFIATWYDDEQEQKQISMNTQQDLKNAA